MGLQLPSLSLLVAQRTATAIEFG